MLTHHAHARGSLTRRSGVSLDGSAWIMGSAASRPTAAAYWGIRCCGSSPSRSSGQGFLARTQGKPCWKLDALTAMLEELQRVRNVPILTGRKTFCFLNQFSGRAEREKSVAS